MNKENITTIIIILIISIGISLILIWGSSSGENTELENKDINKSPEPFTREYLMLNGKLAPELESPLERIERQYNE